MSALTTYDVSLVATGTDDMPLVEECAVPAARIVEIMRTLLGGPKALRGHQVIASSSHAWADGTVSVLKVWRVRRGSDDGVSVPQPEYFDLAIGTVTTRELAPDAVEVETLSLMQLYALERSTWCDLMTAEDLDQNTEDARRAHDAVVDRCNTALLAASRAKRLNPAHVTATALGAYTLAERSFERTVYGS